MAFAYLLLTYPSIKNYYALICFFFLSYAQTWKANLEYLSGYGDGLRLMCLEMGESASLITYLRVANK